MRLAILRAIERRPEAAAWGITPFMNELWNRIAASAETDAETAKVAVGHILSYMRSESDDPAVGRMIEETPGAADAVSAAGETDFSGGIMALGAKLMGLGLDMGQIRSAAEELVAYSKSTAGDDTVNQAIQSVPALAPFV